MGDEQSGELAAAYRLEVARLRQSRDQALIKALGEIAALRGGQDLAARSLASRVLDEVAVHAETAVDALIDAHFRAGQSDPDEVTERIRSEFLSAALGSPPATALFSGRGVQPAAGGRFAAQHAAECSARLSTISSRVKDRVLVRRSLAKARAAGSDVPPGWPMKYERLELLGVGGYARVYSARAPDGGVVAIKVPDDHEEARKRSLREIDALRECEHANVMPVLDYAEDGAWFAMPRAEATLAFAADLGRIEGSRLEEVVRAIAGALEHAHSKGLVHRDLSPGNILRVDDRWMVSDWGLAKLPPDFKRSAMTKSGLGTAPWAAPEVLSDPANATSRADLFSLGRIVGWLVTGATPEVNRPTVMPPANRWYDFVHRATQFRAEERPATAAELTSLIPTRLPTADSTPRPMPAETFTRLLWNIHLRHGMPEAFSAQYAVAGSEIERRALEVPIPKVPRPELSEVVGRAVDQIAEYVTASMPSVNPVRTGGHVLAPTETAEHSTRFVVSDLPGEQERLESLQWNREEHYPGGGYQSPTGLFLMSDLAAELRECVAVLDAEATSMATRAIDETRRRNWSAG